MLKLLVISGILTLGFLMLFGCGQDSSEITDTIVYELPG